MQPERDEGTLQLRLQHRIHLGEFLRRTRQQRGQSLIDVVVPVFGPVGLSKAHATLGRIERACLEGIPVDRLLRLLAYYQLELRTVLTRTEHGQPLPVPKQTRDGTAYRVRQVRLALGMNTRVFANMMAVGGSSPHVRVEAWESGRRGLELEDYLWMRESLGPELDLWWVANCSSQGEFLQRFPGMAEPLNAGEAVTLQ